MTAKILTPQQAAAIDFVLKGEKKSCIHIGGYAGTGKTTVMAELASRLGDQCIVMAPTNKAAENLRNKGIDAYTVHSILYAPNQKKVYKKDIDGNILYEKTADGSFRLNAAGEKKPMFEGNILSFSEKDGEQKLPPYALIDEASMISREMYTHIRAKFKYCIFFGDPFQLPPVGGEEFFVPNMLDIFFTEVHRVALDSPITNFATMIREGKNPTYDEIRCEAIKYYPINNSAGRRENVYEAILHRRSQVLCGRNHTRHMVNNDLRDKHGLPAYTLQAGEPIVACENVRTFNEGERVLVFYNSQVMSSMSTVEDTGDPLNHGLIKVSADDGFWRVYPFWNKGFFDIFDKKIEWDKMVDEREHFDKDWNKGAKFDYAYALTVHRAQGSEFDDVTLFDERECFGKNAQRWFYTGITRTKGRLLIV